jgi:uncharacterized repeat protein (TIGR04076 family)
MPPARALLREWAMNDADNDSSHVRLADLRVTVVAIEGRSVCGLRVGDWFEVTESSRVRIPPGKHFCLFALAAVLPLLPAKMRALDPNDWLSQDSLVACPDPDERVIMCIERLGERELRTRDLT